MLDKFDAANGGTGIVMNAKTGAILAMASYPNYDPGDFSAIYTETLQAELEAELAAIQQDRGSYETEEDYSKALSDARINAQYMQWRNKCYQDTYEPGSTYKPITLAMALEEGTVNMNSTFNCTGSIVVDGWTMHCSKAGGPRPADPEGGGGQTPATRPSSTSACPCPRTPITTTSSPSA